MPVTKSNLTDAEKIFINGAWRTILKVSKAMAAGTTDIVDPAGAFSVYVVGWQFSCDTDATTLKFIDSTPADLTLVQTFMKGGGEVVFPSGIVLLKTASTKKFQATVAVGTVTGTFWYVVF